MPVDYGAEFDALTTTSAPPTPTPQKDYGAEYDALRTTPKPADVQLGEQEAYAFRVGKIRDDLLRSRITPQQAAKAALDLDGPDFEFASAPAPAQQLAQRASQDVESIQNLEALPQKDLRHEQLKFQKEQVVEDLDLDKVLAQLQVSAVDARAGLKQALAGVLRGVPTGGTMLADTRMDLANRLSENARGEARQAQEMSEQIGGGKAGQQVRMLGSTAIQSVPALLATPFGGLPAVATAAGAQSFGSVEDEAFQRYKEQGFDDDEARRKAAVPALIAGAVTGSLTRYMGGGVEKLFQQMASGQVTREAGVAAVKGAIREALKEFPEEALDQLSQGIVAKASYNPNKPVGEIVSEAMQAGAAGVLLGGVFAGATAPVAAAADKVAEVAENRRFDRGLQESADEIANRATLSTADVGTSLRFRNKPQFGGTEPGVATDPTQALPARPGTQPQTPLPGEAGGALKPIPENWLIAVQPPQDAGNGQIMPGNVQVIDPTVTDERATSPTLESLKAQGFDVPDFSSLPKGRYTVAEALRLLKGVTTDEKGKEGQKVLESTLGEEGVTPPARPATKPRDVVSTVDHKGRKITVTDSRYDEAEPVRYSASIDGGPTMPPGSTPEGALEAAKAWLDNVERSEPHTLKKSDYRFHPRALLANETLNPPGGQITPEFLFGKTTAELKSIAQVLNAPSSGTKAQIRENILKTFALRTKLSKETAETLQTRSLAELEDMLKTAGQSTSIGNKPQKAIMLINWRNRSRFEGSKRLAEANHYWEVKRAIDEGKTVPPEILAEYPATAYPELHGIKVDETEEPETPAVPEVIQRLQNAINKFKAGFEKMGVGVRVLKPGDQHYDLLDKTGGIAADNLGRNEMLIRADVVERSLARIASRGVDADAALEAMIHEEYVHFAQAKVLKEWFDKSGMSFEPDQFSNFVTDHYKKIWGEMTPEQREFIKSSYGESHPNGEAGLAMEYVRQLVQTGRTGMPTEAHTRVPQPTLVQFLKDILAALQSFLTQNPSTQIQAAIKNVNAYLDALEGVSAPPAKKPTDGNLKTTPQKSDKDILNQITNEVFNRLTMGETVTRAMITKTMIGPGTGLTSKQVDEAAELGVVKAAQEIIAEARKAGQSNENIFDALVDLYLRQPNLTSKTSTSKINQAYSTPAPIAWLANVLADLSSAAALSGFTYEPTAGNGMLLIGAEGKIWANEIDPQRLSNLQQTLSSADSVSSFDASETAPPPNSYVRVVANPPFGSVVGDDGKKKRYELAGLPPERSVETRSIDHAIVMKALSNMSFNGRASLIIGAPAENLTDTSKSEAYRRDFYFFLYEMYNVVDHFTVSGDLYAKQGAGWPIDIIVIDGKRKSALPLPSIKVPPLLKSWDELRTKLNTAKQSQAPQTQQGSGSGGGGAAGGPTVGDGSGSAAGGSTGTPGEVPGGQRGSKSGATGQPPRPPSRPPVTPPDSKDSGRGAGKLGSDQGTGSGTPPLAGPPTTGRPALSDKARAILEKNKAAADKLRGKFGPTPSAAPEDSDAELDSETQFAGIQLTQEFLKGGITTWTDYAEQMVAAFGAAIEPYIRGWYENARYAPGTRSLGLTLPAEIDAIVAGKPTKPEELHPFVTSEEKMLAQGWTQQQISEMKPGERFDIVRLGFTPTDKRFPFKQQDIHALFANKTREEVAQILSEYLADPRVGKANLRVLRRNGGIPVQRNTPFEAVVDRVHAWADRMLNAVEQIDGLVQQLDELYADAEAAGDMTTDAQGDRRIVADSPSQQRIREFLDEARDAGIAINSLEYAALQNLPAIGKDIVTKKRASLSSVKKDDTKAPPTVTTPPPSTQQAGGSTVSVEGSDFQTEYKPQSQLPNDMIYVPENLAAPIQKALERVRQEVGDTDEYVRKNLGMSQAEFSKAFLAHQADALALAMYNVERGEGVIIGDQTGVGKGRVVAAMLVFAKRTGRIPVFVTKKKGLYKDMFRDLGAIGAMNFKPIITDGGLKNYTDEFGRVWDTPGSKEQAQKMRDVAKNGLPKDIDGVFTTYDQLKADKPEGFEETKQARNRRKRKNEAAPDGPRMEMLRRLAPNAIFILDESHTGAGKGSDVGVRLRQLLGDSQGVVYSSATWAKNPTTIPLYFRTSMRETGLNAEQLEQVMVEGGVPLQQAISSMLAIDGQYIRRERGFKGIEFAFKKDKKNAARDEAMADTYTEFMFSLLKFSNLVAAYVEQLDTDAKDTAEAITGTPDGAGVDSTNFGSRLFEFTNQYILALKAETVAQEAIEALKRGEKPVIALQNTMEGPLDDILEMGLTPDFNGVLLRQLEKLMTIKRRVPGKPEPIEEKIDPARMPDGGKMYRELKQEITDADLGEMPISPIDYIRERIETAGYKTGEVTGRKKRVFMDGSVKDRPTSERSAAGNNEAMTKFNNGGLDAIVLNASGSTGYSLHADKTFKDQKTRHMIVAQAIADINDFIQMLGRINRTGQVIIPRYTLLTTSLPSEVRNGAFLYRKMASLNANTTSNSESDTSVKSDEAVEVFNKYGDEVTKEVLINNLSIARLLSFEQALGGISPDDATAKTQIESRAAEFEEDGAFASKVTGYLVVLPIAEQNKFWEEYRSAYKAKIEYLDQIGENDLKADRQDFNAETLQKSVLFAGTGDSQFSGPAHLEHVKIQGAKKPFTVQDVQRQIAQTESKVQADYSKYLQAVEDVRLATIDERKDALAKVGKTLKPETEASINKDFENGKFVVQLAKSKFGKQVVVQTDSGQIILGYVTGLIFDYEHPKTPSRQYLQISTNLSKPQYLSLPLSQLGRVQDFTMGPPQEFEQRFTDTADSSTERWVVTGNLLGGYSAINKMQTSGRIITYTTKDGGVQTGIMLPSNFKGGAVIPIQSGAELIAAVQNGKTVTTPQGVEFLWRDDNLMLRVPSSKAGGGFVWQDPRINRELSGGEFVQVGNSMVGQIEKPDMNDPGVQRLFEVLTKQLNQQFSYMDEAPVQEQPKPLGQPGQQPGQPPSNQPPAAPKPKPPTSFAVTADPAKKVVLVRFSQKPDAALLAEFKAVFRPRWNMFGDGQWAIHAADQVAQARALTEVKDWLARYFPPAGPIPTAAISDTGQYMVENTFELEMAKGATDAARAEMMSASSQAFSPLSIIDNKAKVLGYDPSVARDLGVGKFSKVMSMVNGLGFPSIDYMAVRASSLPEGWKNMAAKDTMKVLRQTEIEFAKRRVQLREQEELIRSARFTKLAAREDVAAKKVKALEAAIGMFKSQMATAAAKAQEVLKDNAATQAQIDKARQEFNLSQQLLTFEAAIKQRLEDMMTWLAKDTEGFKLLHGSYTPTALDLITRYNELKDKAVASGDPIVSAPGWIPHRGREQEMLNLAVADVLARNNRLAKELGALYFDIPLLKSALSKIEQYLVNALHTNPEKALQKIMDRAADLGDERGRTYAAWLQLNRKMVSAVQRYTHLQKQVQLAQEIEQDQNWRTLVNTVREDAGEAVARPARMEAEQLTDLNSGFDYFRAYEPIPLPDGSFLNIKLRPYASEIEENFKQMHKALDALSSWLTDPANTNQRNSAGDEIPNTHHQDFKFWEYQFNRLNNIFMSQMVLRGIPSKDRSLFTLGATTKYHGSWQMADFMFKAVQTPAGHLASLAAHNWKAAYENNSAWTENASREIDHAVIIATRAHGFHKDNVSGVGALQWYNEIGNELFWSGSKTSHSYKVGDTLGSGAKVLREDMDAMRLMHAKIQELISLNVRLGREKVMQPARLEDDNGVWRRQLHIGDMMLPRKFDPDKKAFIRDVVEAVGWSHDTDLNRPTSITVRKWVEMTPEAKAEFIRLLETQFDQFFYAFTKDRSPDFARVKPWESVYKRIADALAEDASHKDDPAWIKRAPHSVKELIDYIEGYTGTTIKRDEIEAGVFDEVIRQFENVYNQLFQSSPKQDLQEQTNAFTAPRESALASFFFYKYGLANTPDIVGFGMDAASYYFKRYLVALEGDDTERGEGGLVRDLKESVERYNEEAKALRLKLGISKEEALKQARQNQLERIRANEAYMDYQNAEDLLDQVRQYIKTVKDAYGSGGQIEREQFRAALRVYSDFQKAVLISVGSANNILGSAIIGANVMAAHTNSALAYARVASEFVKNVAKIGVPAAARTLGYGLRNLGRAPIEGFRTMKATGSLRRGVARGVGAMFDDIGDAIWGQSKAYRALKRLGYHAPKPLALTVENMMLQMGTRGRNYVPQHGEAIWGAALTGLEIPLDVAGAFFPRFFDMVANISLMNSAARHVQLIEAQLRRAWADAPAGRFDLSDPHNPANALLPSEIVPEGILRSWGKSLDSSNNLKETYDLFLKAGVSLQEHAIEYFKKLAAEPDKTKWVNIPFLTEDQIVQIGAILAEDVNKATPLNRINKQWFRIALSFQGFWFNALRRMLSQGGHALTDPSKPQWVMKGLALMSFIAFGLAVGGVGGGYLQEYQNRWLYRLIYAQDRAFRLPHEGTGDQRINSLVSMLLAWFPVVGTQLSMLVSNSPNKPGVGFQTFAQNRVNDFGNWIVGALKSGDPTYRLPQLIGSIVPMTKVVLNRMPGFTGILELKNAERLLQRTMDDEMVKKGGSYSASHVSELTPYGDKIVNAMMRGDLVEAQKIKAEAVEVAKELGKSNPEKSVEQMIESRNPINRAFAVKPTEAQLEETINRLGAADQEQVRAVLQRFQQSANALGASANLTKEQSASSRSGSVSGGESRTAIAASIGGTPPIAARVSLGRRPASPGMRTSLRLGGTRSRVRKPRLRLGAFKKLKKFAPKKFRGSLRLRKK